MHSTAKAARIAGATYLLLVVTAPFSLMYIPSKLIVSGNPAATASNILAHETLFRLSIVGALFTSVIFMGVGLALYHLLRQVNKGWARIMVALVLVSAGIGFLSELNRLAALLLIRGGDYLAAFDQPQREALAMFFLKLQGQSDFMNEIFWGLWLLPFGLLVYRSGFLPRFLGVWLILNCFAYLILSAIALLFPQAYPTVFSFSMPLLLGEVAITLWLLIKGARLPSVAVESNVRPASGAFA